MDFIEFLSHRHLYLPGSHVIIVDLPQGPQSSQLVQPVVEFRPSRMVKLRQF